MAVLLASSPIKDVTFQRVLLSGLLVRACLFALAALCDGLSERPEISTPAASWKRRTLVSCAYEGRQRCDFTVREGVYLFESGLDPYEGDMYQQSPLLLAVFSLIPLAERVPVAVLFTLADTVAAWLLWTIAAARKGVVDSSVGLKIEPGAVAAMYYLHPFSLAACAARSPLVLSTLLSLSSLVLAQQGQAIGASINLAIASCLTLYPVLLLPPVILLSSHGSTRVTTTRTSAILSFLLSFAGLGLLCRYLMGSWRFLRALRLLLSVSDLTPNVGLSWYLFIEMFDHFRDFFVGAFHLHTISYVIPLCIKFSHDPLFVVALVTGIIAIFKSYPTVGDVSVFHALVSLFPELAPHMRHTLFSGAVLLWATSLLPTFHHLWLYAGSGNANFFYASTLVWAIANGALLSDALYAHLKRDFLLQQTGEEVHDDNVVVIQE